MLADAGPILGHYREASLPTPLAGPSDSPFGNGGPKTGVQTICLSNVNRLEKPKPAKGVEYCGVDRLVSAWRRNNSRTGKRKNCLRCSMASRRRRGAGAKRFDDFLTMSVCALAGGTMEGSTSQPIQKYVAGEKGKTARRSACRGLRQAHRDHGRNAGRHPRRSLPRRHHLRGTWPILHSRSDMRPDGASHRRR